MKHQKVLAGALIASIGLSGCEQQTLEGTVKEEFGTAQRIVESNVISENVYVNGSPILTYGLVLETNKGEYVIDVKDYSTKPICALAKAIEPGDRIKIVYNRQTYIRNDRIGTTNSDTIELIEKAKE